MALLDDVADRFRREVEAREAGAVEQMRRAWQTALGSIVLERSHLMAQLDAARRAGRVPPSWLQEQRRLQHLSAVARGQVFGYAGVASRGVAVMQAAALGDGREHAVELGDAAALRRVMVPSPVDLVARTVGHLADGSPVDAVLRTLPEEVDAQLRAALIQGVALGRDDRWILERIDIALDVPRWRVERLVRTEYQRVYRLATQATFQANKEHVAAWLWRSKRDAAVCPCCLSMDGTELPLAEILDGHPLCRCQMIPVPVGRKPRARVRGRDWYGRQSAQVQRAMVGPGKYEALEAGHIGWDDLCSRVESGAWGTMRREASLTDALVRRNT